MYELISAVTIFVDLILIMLNNCPVKINKVFLSPKTEWTSLQFQNKEIFHRKTNKSSSLFCAV